MCTNITVGDGGGLKATTWAAAVWWLLGVLRETGGSVSWPAQVLFMSPRRHDGAVAVIGGFLFSFLVFQLGLLVPLPSLRMCSTAPKRNKFTKEKLRRNFESHAFMTIMTHDQRTIAQLWSIVIIYGYHLLHDLDIKESKGHCFGDGVFKTNTALVGKTLMALETVSHIRPRLGLHKSALEIPRKPDKPVPAWSTIVATTLACQEGNHKEPDKHAWYVIPIFWELPALEPLE